MIIATAGHIDHGKTSLVRALTGAETDRLPEERARGISIDLGFAHWRPAADILIGFVDVPGHERFVRNMLAGVAGASFALLVVAADDGVMPQTIEHLQILDLLGIERGIIAVTKVDRVSGDRLGEVRTEIAGLLEDTRLAAAPLVEVSSLTGTGLAELERLLIEAAAEPESQYPGLNFRMAIDRAFTVTGAGTVVTGTIAAGAIETGDRLILLPAGTHVRVRSIERAGDQVTSAQAGQRCALNIAGAELSAAGRGNWLVAERAGAPSLRMEARVNLLADAGQPLKHDRRIHLHLGTADIPARVLVPRQTPIKPGGNAIVQLVLDRPAVAATGDRFVIRDQSGRRLLGGGRVVVPALAPKRRRNRNHDQLLAALERRSPREALQALLAIDGHEIDGADFAHSFNLNPDYAAALFEAAGTLAAGPSLIPRSRAERVRNEIVGLVAAYHREQPEAAGMPVRSLYQKISEPVSSETFGALLKLFAGERLLKATASIVSLPDHSPTFSAYDTALWNSLLPWLDERGPRPFTAAEAAAEARTNLAAVQAMLFRRRSSGDLWRINKDQFMLRDHVAALAATAAKLSHGQGFTAAQYRDASGIGRNLAIKLLEFFDTLGVTARRGDTRQIRPGFERIVGEAAPIKAARRAA